MFLFVTVIHVDVVSLFSAADYINAVLPWLVDNGLHVDIIQVKSMNSCFSWNSLFESIKCSLMLKE